MAFDEKKFKHQIPPVFLSILKEIETFGLVPTLVGGAVRDFILKGETGVDWDIELSHPTLSFNKDLWKSVGKALSSFGKVSFLPYEIIRLDVEKYQLEFSPARIENFNETPGHSNFHAEFNFKLPFKEAVLRRDFTINAMGVRFINPKSFEFLDPLEGLLHLHEKTLHYAGADFSKDPVRFLRAVRFAIKLNFSFSTELEKTLEEMSLMGITSTYVWNEMQKSGSPIEFYKELIKLTNEKKEFYLPYRDNFFEIVSDFKKVLIDPTKQESWIVALEWIGLSVEDWVKYFSLSSETGRRLSRWSKASKIFIDLKPESFQGEFDQVRELPEFDILFDWYFSTKQLLQKHPDMPLMKMIEEYLPDWIHLYRFEAVKDVKHIDPPLRAKYQVWNLCQRL